MGIYRKSQRKVYFITKYKKSAEGEENKKVRRVRYFNDYYLFGFKVYSKLVAVKKARDQYGLNPLADAHDSPGLCGGEDASYLFGGG